MTSLKAASTRSPGPVLPPSPAPTSAPSPVPTSAPSPTLTSAPGPATPAPGPALIPAGPDKRQDGDLCHVIVERIEPELQSVLNTSIPDELLVNLSSTVCGENASKPSVHQRKGCTLRRPDAVWHHPFGRKKYKHFLEQPTSLTGAGRDISFLCEAAPRKATTLPPLSEKVTDTQNMSVLETVIPEEYHIVKNKGLRSLELYEDAFTVQLQDDEQKFRVFPSMKPSGRQEALQLNRVMDDMLEKAGVEQLNKDLHQFTQIEGLLELVWTEQNIYNIVFQEVIRQVTVGCAERGQLLAKLRLHYQSLLERVPLYLKTLHTEAVAQRALDRQLTAEIHRIKTSLQQLSRELGRVKIHDDFVSQQAERAQQELAKALGESQNNAEVVQRYHELYELQRSRLNSEVQQVAEERDIWSHVTYCLALKLIRVKNLQLVEQVQTSEETWHQTAESCCLFISTKDTEDLKSLLDISVCWIEALQKFMSSLRKRDRAQSQHLWPIQQNMAKWQVFCTSQQQNPVQKSPSALMEEMFNDLKSWTEVLGVLRERFQGEEVLDLKETQESLVTVRDEWSGFGLQVLLRHSSPQNASSQHYQTFIELQNLLAELERQMNDHITGENGVHSQLQSLSESIEPWLPNLETLKEQPHKELPLDLKSLEKSLAVWQSLVVHIFKLTSSAQTEEQTSEPAVYTESEDVVNKVKVFVETLTTFVDNENQTVSREITSIHMARTRWMLHSLILLVPDLEGHRPDRYESQHITELSVEKLEDGGGLLAQKVDLYSTYLTRTVQLIYEEQAVNNPTQKSLAEAQMMESRKLESEGVDWVDTSKILLSSLKMAALSEGESEAAEKWNDTEAQNLRETEEEQTKSPDESPEQEVQQRAPSAHNSPVLELIASDRSITEKELGDSTVQLTGSDGLDAAPVSEDAQRAFDELNTMATAQQLLQESEEQVKNAQQRAIKAEEALQAALQKIQELERQMSRRTSLVPEDNTKVSQTQKPEPCTSAAPPAKAAPVKKVTPDPKRTTSSRKTRKR